MQNIIQMALNYVPLISQVLMAITILATILARAFPKEKALSDGLTANILKVISYLPTLGIDPRTKALEEALKDLQNQP